MFCGKCGTKINDGDSFCTNCGAKAKADNGTDIFDNFKNQIKASKCLLEYPDNIMIDDIKGIFFGSTISSNDHKKAEPIEWIVLDKQDSRALLLSKYVLSIGDWYDESDLLSIFDVSSYPENYLKDNPGEKYQIWFLNKGEYENILDEEIEICEYDLIYDENGNTRTELTKKENKKMKLFSLSINEYKKYLNSNTAKSRFSKEYSTRIEDAVGREYENKNGCVPYWLRDRESHDHKFYVTSDGNLFDNTITANYGIRPAMWVKI